MPLFDLFVTRTKSQLLTCRNHRVTVSQSQLSLKLICPELMCQILIPNANAVVVVMVLVVVKVLEQKVTREHVDK